MPTLQTPSTSAPVPSASTADTGRNAPESRWARYATTGFAKSIKISDWASEYANAASSRFGGERFWPKSGDWELELEKCERTLRAFTVEGVETEETTEQLVEEKEGEGAKQGSSRLQTIKKKVIRRIPPALIARAQGIAIYTSMRSGIAPLGGSGGSGLVMGRLPSGAWSAPSFITPQNFAVGLLIGIDIFDVVLLINSAEAMHGFKSHKFTMGAETAVAAGPMGTGGSMDVSYSQGKGVPPIFSYVKSRGLYAGVEIMGQAFLTRFDENERVYHWPGISGKDILEGKVRVPPQVGSLHRALRDAESGKAQGYSAGHQFVPIPAELEHNPLSLSPRVTQGQAQKSIKRKAPPQADADLAKLEADSSSAAEDSSDKIDAASLLDPTRGRRLSVASVYDSATSHSQHGPAPARDSLEDLAPEALMTADDDIQAEQPLQHDEQEDVLILEDGERLHLPPTPEQLAWMEQAGIKDDEDLKWEAKEREEIWALPKPPRHPDVLAFLEAQKRIEEKLKRGELPDEPPLAPPKRLVIGESRALDELREESNLPPPQRVDSGAAAGSSALGVALAGEDRAVTPTPKPAPLPESGTAAPPESTVSKRMSAVDVLGLTASSSVATITPKDQLADQLTPQEEADETQSTASRYSASEPSFANLEPSSARSDADQSAAGSFSGLDSSEDEHAIGAALDRHLGLDKKNAGAEKPSQDAQAVEEERGREGELQPEHNAAAKPTEARKAGEDTAEPLRNATSATPQSVEEAASEAHQAATQQPETMPTEVAAMQAEQEAQRAQAEARAKDSEHSLDDGHIRTETATTATLADAHQLAAEAEATSSSDAVLETTKSTQDDAVLSQTPDSLRLPGQSDSTGQVQDRETEAHESSGADFSTVASVAPGENKPGDAVTSDSHNNEGVDDGSRIDSAPIAASETSTGQADAGALASGESAAETAGASASSPSHEDNLSASGHGHDATRHEELPEDAEKVEELINSSSSSEWGGEGGYASVASSESMHSALQELSKGADPKNESPELSVGDKELEPSPEIIIASSSTTDATAAAETSDPAKAPSEALDEPSLLDTPVSRARSLTLSPAARARMLEDSQATPLASPSGGAAMELARSGSVRSTLSNDTAPGVTPPSRPSRAARPPRSAARGTPGSTASPQPSPRAAAVPLVKEESEAAAADTTAN